MPDVIVNPVQVVVRPTTSQTVVAANVLIQSSALQNQNIIAAKNFTFNDVTVFEIRVVSERIVQVLVGIDVPFNDLNATLKVGDSLMSDRLMNEFANQPSNASIYSSSPNYLYTAPTTVNLYINPGLSSAGSGFVYLLRS